MVALGVGLATTAYALPDRASPGKLRNDGTFRVAMFGIDFVDPAMAYLPSSWLLLDATCAKLMNYPDLRLPDGLQPVPEVAAGYPRVSKDGKTYTFILRRSFRFSNGAKLDARSFERQITRILELRTDGLQYVQGIVGADDVLAGRSSSPAGVVARGNKLVIRLTRPIPDFPARLAMPFFCAVAPGLPADVEGVRGFASAGPYYVADYQPGRRVVLQKNRHYGGKRPHHVDRFVITFTNEAVKVVDEIERGSADWGFLIPKALAERGRELVRKYGVNKSRLFIRPAPELKFFVLNTERRLFKNNARLRRAINFAVNRAELAAAHGYRSVRPTDQYLPNGFPGFRDADIYPLGRPNVRRAQALARGRLRGGKAVLYTVDLPLGIEMAQLMRRYLARIQLDVKIESFPRDVLFKKLATRGEPFDIGWAVGGWLTDYNDPSAFINVLLDGRRIGEGNWSHFNSPRYNRRMARASRLRLGWARYRTYGNLDIALARDAAPMVAYASGNAVTYVSKRLDPRCRILRPQLDLAAVCLKP
jgi:peptide/nickel transport system substrate-binding protein